MIRLFLLSMAFFCICIGCQTTNNTGNSNNNTSESTEKSNKNKITEVKMRIQAYLLPGTIEGSMMSLVFQEDNKIGTDDWGLLYTSIAGFKFEPGYICDLVVKKEELAQVPADHVGVIYSLVKVEKKEKAPADLTFTIYLNKDYLIKSGNKYSILDMPFDCGDDCEGLYNHLQSNSDGAKVLCKWSNDFKGYVTAK